MRLRWIAAFWTLFALFAAVQTWLAMITHGHSVVRIVFYQLCLWGVWAAMTPAIAWFTERVPLTPARRRNVLLHVLTGLTATVVHSFAWIALTIVIRPWDAMTAREIGPALPYAMMARLPLEMMIYFATAGVAQALSLSRRWPSKDASPILVCLPSPLSRGGGCWAPACGSFEGVPNPAGSDLGDQVPSGVMGRATGHRAWHRPHLAPRRPADGHPARARRKRHRLE
jgi:hypothetical protein